MARHVPTAAGCALLAWLGAATALAGAARQPDIVIILADDLGYGDVSCYGATKVRTPHIDRLAAEGMLFTDAHSPSSVCTPSRYGLFTGRYAWRTWAQNGAVWADDPLLIDEGQPTVASLLRACGYTTGCVGKWHLGFGRTDDPEHWTGPDWNGELRPGPLEVGFDYFFGHPTVNGTAPTVYLENHRVVGLEPSDPITIVPVDPASYVRSYLQRPRNGVNVRLRMEGGRAAVYELEQMAAVETAKAVAFIERQAAGPFFLYFAPANIHGPHRPHPRFHGSSNSGRRGDFTVELDWMVGQVLESLDRLRLAENTLVIFSSDNGADRFEQFGHHSNGSLRGEKTTIWEGGNRVPFLARWPGRIPAGSRSRELLSLTDLLATCAAVVECPLPPGAGPDSFNMLPALLGRASPQPLRPDLVMDSWMGLFAIRQGPWKLIPGRGSGGRGEINPQSADPAPGQLYNLAEDLGERHNLYHQHPEIVSRLAALLEQRRKAPSR